MFKDNDEWPKEKRKACAKDSNCVDIDDADEVLYWTEKFQCSRGQLVMAVAKVGNTATAVENQLKLRS